MTETIEQLHADIATQALLRDECRHLLAEHFIRLSDRGELLRALELLERIKR